MAQIELADEPFEADQFHASHLGVQTPDVKPPRRSAVSLAPPPITPIHSPRAQRMIRTALKTYPVVVLSGLPGTGKGVSIQAAAAEVSEDPVAHGFGADHKPGWPSPKVVAPDDTTSVTDIVGGMAPTAKGSFEWVPGLIPSVLEEDRWLVIDELNRADLDRILGPLLPWLAGERVEVGRLSDDPEAPSIILEWRPSEVQSGVEDTTVDGRDCRVYFSGADFRIIGTFNPRDAQRVFPIGRALGRRLKIVPLPPADDETVASLLQTKYPNIEPWLQEAVLDLYLLHQEDPVTRLGPAAFLEIPAYVINAVVPEVGEEGPSTAHREVLAESYLLSVGRDLLALSEEQLQRLGASDVVGERLGADGWAFVSAGLQDLA